MPCRGALIVCVVLGCLLDAVRLSPARAQVQALPANMAEPEPPRLDDSKPNTLPGGNPPMFMETPPRAQPLVDLAAYPRRPLSEGLAPGQPMSYRGYWTWQFLPDGMIYRSYLAGGRESRFASHWIYERDQGWLWDVTLGGRMGMLRYGTPDGTWPEGWQLDIEGAAFPRLSLERDRELVAADFRFGVPLTFRRGLWEGKFAYYHLSSHLGDEYRETFPEARRINYVRDTLVLGVALRPNADLRLYAEAGWAFYTEGGSQPSEFQFGVDYSPAEQSGIVGAPFFAINGRIREEVDFGGNLTVQAGWQWRGQSGHLLRLGVDYLNGKTDQYQFFNTHEDQIGLGLWYDY